MRWGAFIVALGFAGPLLAQARPAAVYPIYGDGVSPSECSELEGTLRSALVRMSRDGALEPANPPTVVASCGSARTLDLACLARAAGTGVVLFGVARRAGAYLSLALSAVDAGRVVSGPVRITVDPLFDDPNLFVAALERLVAGLVRPQSSAGPAPQPAPAAGRPKAPAAAVESSPQANPDAWLGRAALLSGAGAVVALGGGFVSGYLAKKTNDDLSAKYSAHTLSTGDASAYSRVRRYDLIANALFVASGALAVTGLTFWSLLPDENPGMSLSGHF